MIAETIIEKIKRILWEEPRDKVEYYFAKRWLDRNFGIDVGKHEYWGEFILELITKLQGRMR